MGQIWKLNKGLSIELLFELLNGVEFRITLSQDPKARHIWAVFHTYRVIYYIVLLRGSEGFLLNLSGLIRHWGKMVLSF